MADLQDELLTSSSNTNKPPEYSPDNRFSHNFKLISEGKYKKVYLGHDHDNGREVAWNTLNLSTFSSFKKDRILEDVSLFARISHSSFLKILSFWFSSSTTELKIITELATLSLKKFVQTKLKVLKCKILKTWISDLLKGLNYIHKANIVHGHIRSDNVFISDADSSVRIGILNSISSVKIPSKRLDIKALSFIIVECCTNLDLNYENLNKPNPPRQSKMILNQRVKSFLNSCFLEDSAESLLSHEFFSYDPSDLEDIKTGEIEDFFEVSVESTGMSAKCCILISKNDNFFARIPFNIEEDVTESIAEKIVTEYKLPERMFFSIIEQVEMHCSLNSKFFERKKSMMDMTPSSIQSFHYREPSFQDMTPISAISNQCSFMFDQKEPYKISLNIEVKDISQCKKFKIDLEYYPELDSPKSVAQQIISKFNLDQKELNSISNLIHEKLGKEGLESHSRCFPPDLLDFNSETYAAKKDFSQEKARHNLPIYRKRSKTDIDEISKIEDSLIYNSIKTHTEKSPADLLKQKDPASKNLFKIL